VPVVGAVQELYGMWSVDHEKTARLEVEIESLKADNAALKRDIEEIQSALRTK
jgi:hypothetical protein